MSGQQNGQYLLHRGQSFGDRHQRISSILADVAPGIAAVVLQTVQLHQANIMIKQGRYLAARDILEEVDEPVLNSNRRALVDELDGRLNLP